MRWRIVAYVGTKAFTVALVRQRDTPGLASYAGRARAMIKGAESIALERETFDAQGKTVTREEVGGRVDL